MSSFSIRRLNKELESFIKDPSPEYTASPIKDDLYCWHFTIRGPSDTSFENGIYHGIIKLPFSYPNKPPTTFAPVTVALLVTFDILAPFSSTQIWKP